MRNYINYLFFTIFILLITNNVFAEDSTFHGRARLQGSTTDQGIGILGVVEMPDIPNYPGQNLGLVGIQFTRYNYDLSMNFGNLMSKNKSEVVLDTRNSFYFTEKLYSWVNVRWIDITNARASKIYSFAMLDYKLPLKTPIAIGLETENKVSSYNQNIDDYSLGPNILFGLSSHARMEFSYQNHSNLNVPNQFWMRLVIKL